MKTEKRKFEDIPIGGKFRNIDNALLMKTYEIAQLLTRGKYVYGVVVLESGNSCWQVGASFRWRISIDVEFDYFLEEVTMRSFIKKSGPITRAKKVNSSDPDLREN